MKCLPSGYSCRLLAIATVFAAFTVILTWSARAEGAKAKSGRVPAVNTTESVNSVRPELLTVGEELNVKGRSVVLGQDGDVQLKSLGISGGGTVRVEGGRVQVSAGLNVGIGSSGSLEILNGGLSYSALHARFGGGKKGSATVRVGKGGELITKHWMFVNGSDAAEPTRFIIENGGRLLISSLVCESQSNVEFSFDGGVIEFPGDGKWGNLPVALIRPGGLTIFDDDKEPCVEQCFSGPGALTKAGPGELFLGGVNTHTGGIIIAGGGLSITNQAALGSGPVMLTGGALNLENPCVLTNQIVLASKRTVIPWESKTMTWAGPVKLLKKSGVLLMDSRHGLTITGPISGTGGLVKDGYGVVEITGKNIFSGGVVLRDGILRIEDYQALGGMSQPLRFEGGLIGIRGKAIKSIDDLSANWDCFGGGIEVVELDHIVTMSRSLRGDGRFIKDGPGIVILRGTNAIGGLEVRGGTLRLANSGACGEPARADVHLGRFSVTSSSQATSPVVAGVDGILDLGGHSVRVRNLKGNGAVINGSLIVSGTIDPGVRRVMTGNLAIDQLTLADGALWEFRYNAFNDKPDVVAVKGKLVLPEMATVRVCRYAKTIVGKVVLASFATVQAPSDFSKWRVIVDQMAKWGGLRIEGKQLVVYLDLPPDSQRELTPAQVQWGCKDRMRLIDNGGWDYCFDHVGVLGMRGSAFFAMTPAAGQLTWGERYRARKDLQMQVGGYLSFTERQAEGTAQNGQKNSHFGVYANALGGDANGLSGIERSIRNEHPDWNEGQVLTALWGVPIFGCPKPSQPRYAEYLATIVEAWPSLVSAGYSYSVRPQNVKVSEEKWRWWPVIPHIRNFTDDYAASICAAHSVGAEAFFWSDDSCTGHGLWGWKGKANAAHFSVARWMNAMDSTISVHVDHYAPVWPKELKADTEKWDAHWQSTCLANLAMMQEAYYRPRCYFFGDSNPGQGPYRMVPETQPDTHMDTLRKGLLRLNGTGLMVDLQVKPEGDAAFVGKGVYESAPVKQILSVRSGVKLVLNIRNDSKQIYTSGDAVCTPHMRAVPMFGATLVCRDGNGVDETLKLLAQGDYDGLWIGALQPGQERSFTIEVKTASGVNNASVLLELYWNPQDPAMKPRDTFLIKISP